MTRTLQADQQQLIAELPFSQLSILIAKSTLVRLRTDPVSLGWRSQLLRIELILVGVARRFVEVASPPEEERPSQTLASLAGLRRFVICGPAANSIEAENNTAVHGRLRLIRQINERKVLLLVGGEQEACGDRPTRGFRPSTIDKVGEQQLVHSASTLSVSNSSANAPTTSDRPVGRTTLMDGRVETDGDDRRARQYVRSVARKGGGAGCRLVARSKFGLRRMFNGKCAQIDRLDNPAYIAKQ
uniref:Uncharacterized protein n=1 Tax=Plectus sambesii TaxID=2011161 RepID=A0A914X5I1_9BILA